MASRTISLFIPSPSSITSPPASLFPLLPQPKPSRYVEASAPLASTLPKLFLVDSYCTFKSTLALQLSLSHSPTAPSAVLTTVATILLNPPPRTPLTSRARAKDVRHALAAWNARKREASAPRTGAPRAAQQTTHPTARFLLRLATVARRMAGLWMMRCPWAVGVQR